MLFRSNNLANSIGVKGSPEKILSNLILKYHEDEPFQTTEVELMNINGKYGFIFGMGIASRFIDDYVNTDKKPSPLRGAWLLGKAVTSAVLNTKYIARLAVRFDARITLDETPVPFKNFNMLVVGTLETLGFNFRPLGRARQVPGQFQFLGISSTPQHLIFKFPRALLMQPLNSEHMYDAMGSKLTIELDEPQTYQIDGDPQPATTRIEISMGPRLTCIVS